MSTCEPWSVSHARRLDAEAVQLRSRGCFESANDYAERAHQLRIGNDRDPRRDKSLWPLIEMIELSKTDCYGWDQLKERGIPLGHNRPFGPSRNGSRNCRSGSIASGGKSAYCTCDTCF